MLTNVRSKNIARVTNGHCHFVTKYAAYKTNAAGLRKRFERAWNRLKTNRMKRLSSARKAKSARLLLELDTRFGRSPALQNR
jgi:hypothetical protein